MMVDEEYPPELPTPLPKPPFTLEYLRMLNGHISDIVIQQVELLLIAQRIGSTKCVMTMENINYLMKLLAHCGHVVNNAMENAPSVQDTAQEMKQALYDQMRSGIKK